MKVVFIDVDSLGLSSVEDAKWIFDAFDRTGYMLVWVFEDFPFKSGTALEEFIEKEKYVSFKVITPSRFIYTLMCLPIWYRVDGFIVCSKNESFVPLLGCGVDAIWYSGKDVVDFFFYESQGLYPERFLDYSVIMDYAAANNVVVDEDKLLGFLQKYSLEDIEHEMVRDAVMEAGLDFLLRGDFYKVLVMQKQKLSLTMDNLVDIMDIGRVLYGSKRFLINKELMDKGMLEWRFKSRQMFMSQCRVCAKRILGDKKREGFMVSSPVGGAGRLCSKVLIVGEAPGHEEEEKGKPFIGRSGELLNKWLEIVGLSRHDIWITNAALCRLKNAEGKGVAPDRSMVDACRWRVEADILDSLLCNGKIMIWALGKVALDSISGIINVGEMKQHGLYKVDLGEFSVWVLYLLHPSAILRTNDGSSHLNMIGILKSLEKEHEFGWFRE